MANCNIPFDDKCMLFDALNSEKFLASIYSSDVLEAATPEVRRCFCGMLTDEHTLQQDVFETLSSRGYYPVEKAKEDKIMETKQKYGQCVTA